MPKNYSTEFPHKRGSGLTRAIVDVLKGDEWLRRTELIVEQKSGKVRQAGAARAQGAFVEMCRKVFEQNLYAFLVGVLNYHFLQPELHRPVCEWLTTIPPYRKMCLIPRNHGKTVIVAQGMPVHMMIQPKETNMYFPKQPGSHLRLLLAGETADMATRNLRVIKSHLENNALLRAFWPHVSWENARRQAPKWSDDKIIIPRDTEFAEPTVTTIGVGGAITGLHPNAIVKDDLTTQTAANEPPTMAKAIDWHLDSRALFANPDTDLEFITATRWANYDLPGYIEEKDPSVEVNKKWRRVVEDGQVIFPKKYGFPGAVEQLQKEHGIKFPLLFLNESHGEGLTDFLASDLREYELRGGSIWFSENENDVALAEAVNKRDVEPEAPRGMDFYAYLNVANLDYLRNTRSF